MKNNLSKNKYGSRHKLLSKIINSVDPIGLIGGGSPDDEYSDEIAKILSVIKNGNDIKDITDKIYEIFSTSFGSEMAGLKKTYEEIAKK